MKVEKIVPAKPTYSIVDLTEEQFDIIVGCLAMGEYGGTAKGEGVPYKGDDGRVCNGQKLGGSAVFQQIEDHLREDSQARLEQRRAKW